MSDKVQVGKVEIKIGETTVALTMEQVRDLHSLLNDLFPKKETVYLPSTPIYVERRPYYTPWWQGDVYGTDTISSTGGTLCMSLNDAAVEQCK